MATGDVKEALGTLTSITCTMTSLASAGWRETNSVDNSSNLFRDFLLSVRVQLGAITADGTVEIYLAPGDGTIFLGGIAGADAAITWGTTDSTGVDQFNDLIPIFSGAVDTTDDNDDFEVVLAACAVFLGGRVPTKWAVVIRNNTTTAFNATGTNNYVKYQGYYDTVA